jgi:hypothetical protein
MNNEQTDYATELNQCIKEKTNLTETMYTNICTGEKYSVPNGTVDMIGIIFIGLVILSFFVLFCTISFVIIKDLD